MKRSVGLSEHQRGDADQCLVHVLYFYKYVYSLCLSYACSSHALPVYVCGYICIGYIAIIGPVYSVSLTIPVHSPEFITSGIMQDIMVPIVSCKLCTAKSAYRSYFWDQKYEFIYIYIYSEACNFCLGL